MIDLTSAEAALATGGQWAVAPESEFIATGVGIDSREDLAGRLFVAIRGERHDGHDFVDAARERGAVAALVERPLAPSSSAMPRLPVLLVPSTRAALADLARVTRERFNGRVAAITGSCGKTTTRRLLASILEHDGPTVQSPKSFNNDLGVPLTVLALRPHHRHLVSEIGMSAPGEIEPLVRIVRPHVAVITMVGHAHVEALGTIEGIAREKAHIVSGLEAGGTVVLPVDAPVLTAAVDDQIAHAAFSVPPRCATFGRARGDARLLTRRVTNDGSVIEIGGPWGVLAAQLALPGEHNAMNALAAALAAHHLGASTDAIRAGLAGVRPSEMRFVRERIGPFIVLNDAYNANPEAMRASITAFAESERSARRRVTVLGDMLELGADAERLHAEVGAWLASAFDGGPPAVAVFVGERSSAAARAFERAAPGAASLLLADASQRSGEELRAILQPGDALLFKASRGSALERLLASLAAADANASVAPTGATRA